MDHSMKDHGRRIRSQDKASTAGLMGLHMKVSLCVESLMGEASTRQFQALGTKATGKGSN